MCGYFENVGFAFAWDELSWYGSNHFLAENSVFLIGM